MEPPQAPEKMVQEEPSGDFAATSRRAASRPRRATSSVGQEANVAVEDDGRNEPVLPSTSAENSTLGLLEEHLALNPFPFGNFVRVLLFSHEHYIISFV